jgi:hypothetical protein
MSRRLTFPATIPVRNATEAELAASARTSMPLRAGRRLADWFGDGPVDAESGWRSARAQRDAALTLGLVTDGDAMTDETTSRLHWIYEVAYHAGYLHTSKDHELIHRAAELCGGAERTDTEIIGDWRRGLDALFAHGVEDALPAGADPAPLDFHGIGNFPTFKLLEQHGTATADTLSAEIAEGATEGMTPSDARKRWAAWTARHGDPTAAFLRLAAEFGAVTVGGPAVSLTPLGAWAVIQELGVRGPHAAPAHHLPARHVGRGVRAGTARLARGAGTGRGGERAAGSGGGRGRRLPGGRGPDRGGHRGRHPGRLALGDVAARHPALRRCRAEPAGRAGPAARPAARPRAIRM